MAGRVNTKFVFLLSSILVLLVLALAGFYYMVVHRSADELIRQGDISLNDGDKQQALEFYGRALNKRRDDVGLIRKYVDTLATTEVSDIVTARQYVGQMVEWTRIATELNPNDEQLLREFYQMHVDLVERLKSRGYYERLYTLTSTKLDANPENMLARRYRGIAQVNRLTIDMPRDTQLQARDDLQAALDQSPDDAEVLDHRGLWNLFEARRLEMTRGDLQLIAALRSEALELSQKALAVQPEDPARQLAHARMLLNVARDIRRANPQEAESLTFKAREINDRIEKQLLIDPQPRAVILPVVELLLTLEQDSAADDEDENSGLDRAQRLLEVALQAHPEETTLAVNLGRVLAQKGERDAALQRLEQARQISTLAPPVRALRAFDAHMSATLEIANLFLQKAVLLEEGEERESLLTQCSQMIAEVQTVAGEAPAIDIMAGKLALVRNELSEAQLRLNRAADQLGPGSAEAMRLAATVSDRLGDWGAAAKRLSDLLQAQPDLVDVRFQLVDMYLRHRMPDDAETHLNIAMAQAPDAEAATKLWAELLAQRGQTEGALARMESLSATEQVRLAVPMARLYLNLNRTADAQEILRRRLKDAPGDTAALQILLQLVSDPEEQQTLIDSAREGGGNEQVLMVLEARLSGDVAPEALVEELLGQEEDPFRQQLARVQYYIRSGEVDKAREALAKAAALKPDHVQVIRTQLDFALHEKDWPKAQDLVAKAAARNLDMAGGAFYRADLAVARGDLNEAIAEYRRGLSTRGVYSAGWAKLGETLLRNNNFPEAAEAYQRAIEQKPDNVAALRGLAVLSDQRGDYGKALQYIRTALTYSPSDRDLLMQYVAYEQAHGDRNEAIRLRRQLAQGAPDNYNNRIALTLLLADEKQSQEARQMADALIADAGQNPQTIGTLASVMVAAGDDEGAVAAVEQYIASRKDEVQTNDLLVLARLHRSLGDGERSMAAYQRAQAIEDPSDRPATRELADIMFQNGGMAEAIPLYRQLHEQDPADEVIALRLSEALVRADRIDEADKVLDNLTPSGMSQLLKGMAAVKRGDNPAALRLMTQAIELNNRSPQAYLWRAQVLAQDSANDAATVEDLNEALGLDPNLLGARQLLAEIHVRRGETREAIRELNALIRRAPDLAAGRLQLVNLYQNTGETVAARNLLQEAVERFPDDLQWVRLSAQLASMTDDAEGAVRLWQQVVDKEPAPQDISHLATALFAVNRPADVLALCGKHTQIVVEEPSLQAVRGRALVKNGDATGGRQVFARAIERVRSLQELQNVCSQLVQALEFEDAKGLIQDAGKSLDPVWMNMALASQELEHRQFAEAARRLGTLALPAGDTALNHERDLMLAMSLYQVGEYDQARSLYEKLVAAQPDVRTLNNLAYLLVDHYADPKAALPLAQQAAAMAPNTASVLDTLGWIQFKNGQLEQARLTLERSMGIRPLPVTSLHLGQVYAQQNIPARARELLTQAVDLAIVSGETDVRQQANQLLDQIGQAE